jgi:hypothetical protein
VKQVATPFPMPNALVLSLFDDLRLAVERPPETREELRRVAGLPRPWDPPSCPEPLRSDLWDWLDWVALWINEEHCWRVDRLIPNCWREHPHIAHELATVACLRITASYGFTPDPLEEWHRYVVPGLLERLSQRVGATACAPGRHTPHPGATRIAAQRAGSHAPPALTPSTPSG